MGRLSVFTRVACPRSNCSRAAKKLLFNFKNIQSLNDFVAKLLMLLATSEENWKIQIGDKVLCERPCGFKDI